MTSTRRRGSTSKLGLLLRVPVENAEFSSGRLLLGVRLAGLLVGHEVQVEALAVDHERLADLADRGREDRVLLLLRQLALADPADVAALGGLGVVGVVAGGVGERRACRRRCPSVSFAAHSRSVGPCMTWITCQPNVGLDRLEELAGLEAAARRSRPRTPASISSSGEKYGSLPPLVTACALVALRARDRVEQARVGLELGVRRVAPWPWPRPTPGRSRRRRPRHSGRRWASTGCGGP